MMPYSACPPMRATGRPQQPSEQFSNQQHANEEGKTPTSHSTRASSSFGAERPSKQVCTTTTDPRTLRKRGRISVNCSIRYRAVLGCVVALS
uniref:Uncharacterized protein n=1 Tax=Timema monikensis TaxID=170555 RepID=A0A7R9DYG9_9NEOP|nr:unnamed protein product [Timema monikensis]